MPDAAPTAVEWTGVVLAGGRSSRLGHDNARAPVAGRSLLDHVLSTIPPDVPCIVVGPDPQSTIRPVAIATEAEPDGGPVSGLLCGLELVTTPIVVVLAADMPFAGAITISLATSLAESAEEIEAIVPVDTTGRRQLLCGAYRVDALRRAFAELGPPHGRPMRELVERLIVVERPVDEHPKSTLLDVDTREDLESARRSVIHHTMTGAQPMTDWVTAVTEALGINPASVDIDAILDVARESAHGVERPAAPVSTYLMGYAVASAWIPKRRQRG